MIVRPVEFCPAETSWIRNDPRVIEAPRDVRGLETVLPPCYACAREEVRGDFVLSGGCGAETHERLVRESLEQLVAVQLRSRRHNVRVEAP